MRCPYCNDKKEAFKNTCGSLICIRKYNLTHKSNHKKGEFKIKEDPYSPDLNNLERNFK